MHPCIHTYIQPHNLNDLFFGQHMTQRGACQSRCQMGIWVVKHITDKLCYPRFARPTQATSIGLRVPSGTRSSPIRLKHSLGQPEDGVSIVQRGFARNTFGGAMTGGQWRVTWVNGQWPPEPGVFQSLDGFLFESSDAQLFSSVGPEFPMTTLPGSHDHSWSMTSKKVKRIILISTVVYVDLYCRCWTSMSSLRDLSEFSPMLQRWKHMNIWQDEWFVKGFQEPVDWGPWLR